MYGPGNQQIIYICSHDNIDYRYYHHHVTDKETDQER